MQTMTLGRTRLTVSRTGFGAIPIQRLSFEAAGRLLRQAYDAGITFFDTARAYSDSEEKIGRAMKDVRKNLVLATKSGSSTRAGLLEDLETSLRNLQTDWVDILQLHNPHPLPDPDDVASAYAGALEARRQGKVRFIGLTSHRLDNARSGVRSGLYDTLQFPLSAISSDDDLTVPALCRSHDVGVIAMKALCGGLLTNVAAAFAFLRAYDNVVPLWGLQRTQELEEVLSLEASPPPLDAALQAAIARERKALAGDFCRGCGYCLPCPAEIPIPMAARMAFLMRRAPAANFLTSQWRQNMARIEQCTGCGACRGRCPYGLAVPELLRKMYADYQTFLG